jgi:hypothetical protein
MLEADGVLWTWELRELPAAWAKALGCETTCDAESVSATRLADHRLAYLEYEGLVSGSRGQVRRLDGGEFTWILQSPNQIEAVLKGQVLWDRVMIIDDELLRLSVF